ncbi:DUF1904 family protein [Paenibacillus montanisoli]|uniref:DUF1904 domain-containing protein n=1 Tax=Paenibacillus montanisoli TaxID=2081970 RepID=A0A328TYX8_9BACL|nr:DUF1904 family protein [Paenibacillus montanisoli]RAP74962.1 DUF1904 domain-containing protein [Paenibacillus montanisoli]
MPQLSVRGVETSVLAKVSGQLIEDMARICSCGTDNFTIDALQTVSVFGGGTAPTYPFVEIAWFDRGQAVQDELARAVTAHLNGAGVAEVEVAFKVYKESAYYINGRVCG